MTINDVQKAALVLFVAKEVQDAGSMALMRGIALAIRNRVRAGFHDGNWLDVIENADELSGNEMDARDCTACPACVNFHKALNIKPKPPFRLSVSNREIQMFARDIESIFYGDTRDEITEIFGDRAANGDRQDPILYWQFVNRPLRQWFVDNIVRDPLNHKRRTQIGNVVFFT